MFFFIQSKVTRTQRYDSSERGNSSAPAGPLRPTCPGDLEPHYRETANNWTQRYPVSGTLRQVRYDHRLGSLSLTLHDGETVTLAVNDRVNAEQIYSMSRLEPCVVRLLRDGPYVTALVASPSWTYAVSGLPALHC